ncbi:MAG TPA: patatin-like phospholipase family protein [Thermomicrobiales bacterium]|nr:patatin-like phospholipase family protein [Thermomicrobiales bacterium]
MTASSTRDGTGINPTATQHAVEAFLPPPEGERRGVALCLSGGGYRAALFHLGAMRRLNELGILSSVDTIASVSGGSIAAAFIAAHAVEHPEFWQEPGSVLADWETGVAEPLRKLMGTNIRTGAILARFRPNNWFNPNAGNDSLAARLGSDAILRPVSELPPRPRFIFCATNLRLRSQWVVDSGANHVGDDKIGYISPIPAEWTIARAAATSSCFPIAFVARRVECVPESLLNGTYHEDDRDDIARRIELTDGGIYDNLALEPVWRTHEVVLASDGGPSFKATPDLGPLWPGLRYVVTLLEQATEVRQRWLISNLLRGDLAGAYWSMSSLPRHYEQPSAVPTYSDDLIKDVISQFRIDFDACSDVEIGALENHGYAMTELAIQHHARQLIRRPNASPSIPYPQYMDAGFVASEMARSSRNSLLGRGSWR